MVFFNSILLSMIGCRILRLAKSLIELIPPFQMRTLFIKVLVLKSNSLWINLPPNPLIRHVLY